MGFLLDPQATLDFTVDWSAWLGSSETITAQTVTADDAGVTVSNVTQSGGLVTFWLSAGTVNTVQHVTCQITTNQGRTDQRSISVRVVDR